MAGALPRVRRVLATAFALLAATALAAGCGDSEPSGYGAGSGSGGEPELTVFAASSLQPAFEAFAKDFADADIAFSFAGSDALAAQIREGVEPDVYAAANTSYPEDLNAEGLVGEPSIFATNKLVLAVPADSAIDTVAGAAADGTTVAIGQKGVPVGDYTREVIDKLPAAEAKGILANVASEEPDVAGIAGKLGQGAVDAGFVYISDVAASNGAIRAIELPASAAPDIAYGVAIGSKAAEPEVAQEFVDELLRGAGADALAANDFGPPPKGE